MRFYFDHAYVNDKYYSCNGGSATSTTIAGASANNWQTIELKRNSTTNEIFTINDSNTITISTNVYSGNACVELTSKNNGSEISLDWVLVRQYLATDPAWGTWGNEMTN